MIKRSKKLHAERWGRQAEYLACIWLWLHGYWIIQRRLRTPFAEIDLLARQWWRDDLLILIEVKARSSLGEDTCHAAFALSQHQIERLSRAGLWLQANRYKKKCDSIRLDYIAITPWRLPQHFRNITL